MVGGLINDVTLWEGLVYNQHRSAHCNMASSSRNKDAYMAPELRVERERSDLVLEELTNLLDGGAKVTKTRRRIRKQSIEQAST